MINPWDVAMQKDDYKRNLDEQQRQGVSMLTQQTTRQREYIRMQAEQQKVLVNGRLDQHLRSQEMFAEQEYQRQLATLNEQARQQKLGLQKQASQLIMEYNRRRTQEEINHRQYEIQLQHWGMQQQLAAQQTQAFPYASSGIGSQSMFPLATSYIA